MLKMILDVICTIIEGYICMSTTDDNRLYSVYVVLTFLKIYAEYVM